ncbi:hypothetical protein THF5H11_140066 [Vibrio jasicida]|nr:hypothetical protein THF5H11_140066 [Vibrio jasicida]
MDVNEKKHSFSDLYQIVVYNISVSWFALASPKFELPKCYGEFWSNVTELNVTYTFLQSL